MRSPDLDNRLICDECRGSEQTAAGKYTRERIDLSMSVGVILICWLERQTETSPGDHRTEDVARGFNPVRDQRVRIADNANADLDNHQADVNADRQDAETKSLRCRLHNTRPTRIHLRMKRKKR